MLYSVLLSYQINNQINYLCRKLYLCHHSAFNKPEPELNKKGKSKNCHCQAGVNVIVKKDTKNTRYKDKYIKVVSHLCFIIVVSCKQRCANSYKSLFQTEKEAT